MVFSYTDFMDKQCPIYLRCYADNERVRIRLNLLAKWYETDVQRSFRRMD